MENMQEIMKKIEEKKKMGKNVMDLESEELAFYLTMIEEVVKATSESNEVEENIKRAYYSKIEDLDDMVQEYLKMKAS